LPDPRISQRHRQLLSIKVTALVGDHLGDDATLESADFGRGAAVCANGAGWVLVDEQPERQLGAALAWAIRNPKVQRLDLLTEHSSGVLARRAAGFTFPIDVWHVDGRQLLPAVAEPLSAPVTARDEHLDLVDLIAAGGAVPLVEHGVVFGEVRGLEVCRVVDRPETGDVALEVGVGVHDREAFAIIHGAVPTLDALAGVVRQVTAVRGPDVPHHPLNRLAAERLLRWRLEQEPALVGATAVIPAEPPMPRPNVKDAVPCVATGVRNGDEIAVVCSTGVDLDLIAYAADVSAGGRHTVVALPRRDLVPVTRDLAALLVTPVELRAID
jgi:hypothetical protein